MYCTVIVDCNSVLQLLIIIFYSATCCQKIHISNKRQDQTAAGCHEQHATTHNQQVKYSEHVANNMFTKSCPKVSIGNKLLSTCLK